MVSTSQITTAEQLLDAGDIGRCELIRGQLHMMTPAGYGHGRIVNRIAWFITTHVMKHRLGEVFSAETGFRIERDPDTVRAPDVAFIAADRLPDPPPRGYADTAPDLVVEVNSPDDRPREVSEKVRMWLSAGVKQVWLVDPATRTVQVCHPDGRCETFDDQQVLEGGDLLPGFSIAIADLFDCN